MKVEVALRSKRRERVQLFQKVQHGLPSVVLLLNGLRGLEHEGLGRLVAMAEIVSSVLVIGSLARSFARSRRSHVHEDHPHHGVDWVDIFLAAMLAVEAWSHFRETGHLQRPTVLLAATMLILGLMHGRIAAIHARRRSLRADDEGVTIGGRFFTRFTARWDEIDRIEIAEDAATVKCR